MTRDELKHRIQIEQVWMDGKRVQVQYRWSGKIADFTSDWNDYSDFPNGSLKDFASEELEWRVKPEPREWWMCDHCGTSWDSELSARTCHSPKAVIRVREVI
jgi:hypothetical protein